MTLGNRIRNRREELGLTQPELAYKAKASQPYISRLEKGEIRPSMQMLINLSSALNMSIDEMLKDEKRAS